MFQVNETVGISKLRKTYDSYVLAVLGSKLKRLPKEKKGEQSKFIVTEPLPTKEEYLNLKKLHYTVQVSDLIDDAYGEVESLAEELQEWFDNLPEGFQQGDKGSQLEEAISNLQNVQRPDCSDELPFCSETTFYPNLEVSSRSDRRSEASDKMSLAASCIRDFVENIRSQEEEEKDFSDLEEIADQLENDASELENVEFPGMY